MCLCAPLQKNVETEIFSELFHVPYELFQANLMKAIRLKRDNAKIMQASGG